MNKKELIKQIYKGNKFNFLFLLIASIFEATVFVIISILLLSPLLSFILDLRLFDDERVINMERTNIRYLTAEELEERPEFFSVDVSFISLKLVLPVVYDTAAV